MLTTMIVIAAVIVVAAGVAFVILGRGRLQGAGGRGLKRRFGPEYDRAVSRHDGDTAAAEQELGARVERHGSLQEKPLAPGARDQYVAEWADIQKQFVESPERAVAEADALLTRLVKDRGYPGDESFDEQLAALSVHHAVHVDGYRTMHTAVRDRRGTEDMRAAMLDARGLFDDLVTDHSADSHASSSALGRRHAKGSGT
jgi:hypothetical protein